VQGQAAEGDIALRAKRTPHPYGQRIDCLHLSLLKNLSNRGIALPMTIETWALAGLASASAAAVKIA
jgi:hypothetical protein